MNKRVILALNGELLGRKEEYQEIIKFEDQEPLFIAADGGANFLEKIGLYPNIIIGDLDSLTKEKQKQFKKMGVEILRYPVEKDETDGELALNYCLNLGINDIIIIGSMGGRFDQQLANICLLEYAYRENLKAIIREPGLEIGIIGKEKTFCGQKSSTLSLIPLDDRVLGITLTGCKYRLIEEDLFRSKTRGISNLISEENAHISVRTGLLLYILFKHISPSC